MANLLEETLESLKERGKEPVDVVWVGSKDGVYAMGWDQFAAVANVEYDEGFGAPEVATDLVVVGENWWLERHEYDGAEGWSFKSLPTKAQGKPYACATVDPDETGWEILASLNNEAGAS